MIFKEISLKDKKDIEDIGKHTWEGEDYLPCVFEKWISSGNFYGIEENGKIIATGKISILPSKVGWLEGLRVHPEYRGRGYGRAMHDFLIEKAYELKDRGIIKTLEFSTYFQNHASISMGIKDGFKIIKKYYGMFGSSKELEKPKTSTINSINEIEYDEYIPCDWKFIHKSKDALNYLKKNCKVMEYENLKFLFVSYEPWEITPFNIEPDSIFKLLPALSYHTSKYHRDFSLKIPIEFGFEKYKNIGLKKWEEVPKPEILVFRKNL